MGAWGGERGRGGERERGGKSDGGIKVMTREEWDEKLACSVRHQCRNQGRGETDEGEKDLLG